MTNNQGKCIQLQIDPPCAHSLIYNSQKYPINFDLFKYTSKYFFELRNEIPETGDIDLTKYDPEDDISNFSPDEVIDFIKYIQIRPLRHLKMAYNFFLMWRMILDFLRKCDMKFIELPT